MGATCRRESVITECSRQVIMRNILSSVDISEPDAYLFLEW